MQLQWYASTLSHYLGVAIAIAGAMWLTNRVLRLLGLRGDAAMGLALVVPWLLGFLIWNVGPIAASLYFSFTDYNILQTPNFVGLANYERLLGGDPNFWPSVRLTMAYAALTVPIGLAGSVLAAIMLNQGVKGIGLWRTLYYLPAILPAFVTALLWRLMFLPTRSGLVNAATEPIWSLFGDKPPGWFLDRDMLLWGFVIMSFWGVFGANTVIVLAGLKNIPRDLYEAASVDGAGVVARLRHITLPQLSPTLFYLVVMGIIAAVQIFDQPLFIQLPPGSPAFLNVYLYSQGFTFFQMGYASAIAWFMFVVILLLTLGVFRSSEAWVYYESEGRK
ncbi:MAG: sugar ABC transporter permease [Chloroflexi bacterium]|nr:sugar ABC transporter permease [Chloroflexota bacterium]